MRKTYWLLPLIALLVSGCAGHEMRESRAAYYAAQAALIHAQAAQEAQPLLALKISQDGKLEGLTLGRQGSSLASMPPPPRDESGDIWRAAISTVGTIGSIYYGGHAAAGLVRATGAAVSGALTHVPDPVVVPAQQPLVVEPVVVQQPPYNAPILVPTQVIEQPIIYQTP
jgi:hypothetical protein